MRNVTSLLKSELYRGFFSSGFIVGIIATILIFFFGSVGMISKNVSAVAAFNNTLKYNNISQLLILSSTFAYAASFCTDWQNRFYFPLIIRSQKAAYIVSKCIAAAVLGGLSVVIGAAFFIGYVCITQPDILPEAIEIELEFSYQAFGDLLVKKNAAGFFLSYLYILFLQAAFFSSLGLTVSAYLPNRYVAYASPFILSFLLNQIANVWDFPIWLDPVKLATARIFGTPTGIILRIATAAFLSYIIICHALFIRKVKRRIANA